MLSRKQCPHTGIVNFFEKTDPHLAIGSAVKLREAGTYHWLSFASDCDNGGIADDLRSAERHISQLNAAALAMSAKVAKAQLSDAA